MKALCICQYGHSRSVAMCRSLHAKGHEAVAVGYDTAPSAIRPLYEWADVVIFMANNFILRAGLDMVELSQKGVICHVGPDVWSNPYHPELKQLCDAFVREKGW